MSESIFVSAAEGRQHLKQEISEAAPLLGRLYHRGFGILSSFFGGGQSRVIYEKKNAGARVEPSLHGKLKEQYNTMEDAVKSGIRESLATSGRLAFGVNDRTKIPAGMRIAGMRANLRAVMEFAREYAANAAASVGGGGVLRASSAAQKLKRASSSLSSGVLASIYLGLDSVAKKTSEFMEKSSDAGLMAQIKVSEAARKIYSRKAVRWAGYGVIFAGLAAMGLSAFSHAHLADSLKALAQNHSPNTLAPDSAAVRELTNLANLADLSPHHANLVDPASDHLASMGRHLAHHHLHLAHGHPAHGHQANNLVTATTPVFGVDSLTGASDQSPQFGVDSIINQIGSAHSGAAQSAQHLHHAAAISAPSSVPAPDPQAGTADRLMDDELKRLGANGAATVAPPAPSAAAVPAAPLPPAHVPTAATPLTHPIPDGSSGVMHRGYTTQDAPLPSPSASPAAPFVPHSEEPSGVTNLIQTPDVANAGHAGHVANPGHVGHVGHHPVHPHGHAVDKKDWDSVTNQGPDNNTPWDAMTNQGPDASGLGEGVDQVSASIDAPHSAVENFLSNLPSPGDWVGPNAGHHSSVGDFFLSLPDVGDWVGANFKPSLGASSALFNAAPGSFDPITTQVISAAARFAANPPPPPSALEILRACDPSLSADPIFDANAGLCM